MRNYLNVEIYHETYGLFCRNIKEAEGKCRMLYFERQKKSK